MKSLSIKATKPQAEFHQLQCKYPCFVAGFGSGKSQCMVNQAIIDSFASKEALIYLHAPNYTLVRDVISTRLRERLEEMGIKFKFNKTEMEITPEHPQMGRFRLRSLDDPAKLVGYEAYRTHVDELDTLPMEKARDVWNQLMARTRQTLSDVPKEEQTNRVCAYSTPEGFSFIYNRWVEEKHPEYQMVRASSHSNPHLPDDYIDTLLASYPKALAEAYINGEFVNLTAGTVYRSYDRFLHNSVEKVNGTEPLYVGMDFNIDNMAATIYVKRGDTWHAVDEVVKFENTPKMCEEIRRRYSANPITVYPDNSGIQRSTATVASLSDIAILESHPYNFMTRYRRKNPAVKDRIQSTNVAFEKKKVFINYLKCPTVANSLEKQAYDQHGMPDKDSDFDHQNDATTYLIEYEMPVHRPVAHVPFSFAV
jgi:hypothetical protein